MPTAQWRTWLQSPVSKLFMGVNVTSLVKPAMPVSQMMMQMSKYRLSYLMVAEEAHAGRPLLGLVTERRCVDQASKGLLSTSSPTSEIMLPLDRLLTIPPDATVHDALLLLNEKIYRHIPVLEEGTNVPVGTLKLRDVLQPISSRRGFEIPYAKFTPSDTTVVDGTPQTGEGSEGSQVGESSEIWGEVTVKDVLTAKRASRGVDVTDDASLKQYHKARSQIHTINDSMSVADAMSELIRRKLTFLVVKDGQSGRVLGLVTERSFLGLIATTHGGDADGGIVAATTPPAGGALLSTETLAMPVREVMTPNAEMLSVRTDQKADRCLALMIGSNIRHLPVLAKDGSALAGILSIRDLIAPLVPDGNETAQAAAALPWWRALFGT
jgi:CBS domain-containing protein